MFLLFYRAILYFILTWAYLYIKEYLFRIIINVYGDRQASVYRLARIACCRRPLFRNAVPRIHQMFRCVIYYYVYFLFYSAFPLGYSSNVRALSKR